MTIENVEDGRIFVDEDMEAGAFFAVANGLVAVFSRKNPDNDPANDTSNQDGAAIFPVREDCAVLAVADGCGGLRSGNKASALALAALKSQIDIAIEDGIEVRSAILNGYEAANKAVLGLGIGAATTLAVVEVTRNTVRPYNVGDSMIMVVGQKGKLKFQNVPHSPVGYALESGLFQESEAMMHEERHIVSNLVGAADMSIEVGSAVELSPNDTVVIASDGLSDNLTTDEIIERVRKGQLDEVVDALVQSSKRRMNNENAKTTPSKPDDLTFLAYRLE